MNNLNTQQHFFLSKGSVGQVVLCIKSFMAERLGFYTTYYTAAAFNVRKVFVEKFRIIW